MAFDISGNIIADGPSTGASTSRGNTTTSGGGGGITMVTPAQSLIGHTGAGLTTDETVGLIQIASVPQPEGANPIPTPSTEPIFLDIALNNTRPIDANGLSEQRPEILAAINFIPATTDVSTPDQQGPVSQLLDIQLTARQLRSENVSRLINELRADGSTAPVIEGLEAKLADDEQRLETEVRFMQEMVQRLALTKNALSVKLNSTRLNQDIAARGGRHSAADPARDVVVDVLGFSDDGYRTFTETKVLMQLGSDLLDIIKSQSPQLIDRISQDRSGDVDPYAIRSLAGQSHGPFSVSRLSSTYSSDIRNVLSWDGLQSFLLTLQGLSSEDRLRVLTSVLSKELRVSTGLSIQNVRKTISRTFGTFDSQIDGTVFDTIIGRPGQTIFDSTTGAQFSLMSFLRVQSGDDIIFPFESSFIRRLSNAVALPGHAFYVDSIIRGEQKFLTTPLRGFATSFGSFTTALGSIIEGTFDVDVINDQALGLSSHDVFKRVLQAVQPNIVALAAAQSPADAFMSALLRLAADDVLLKHMLVLYVLYVGVSRTREPDARSDFFETLVASTDLNVGTGLDKETHPLAGIIKAINEIASVVPRSVPNIPDARAGVDDDFTRLVVGLSARPGTAGSLSDNGLDVLSALIIERVYATQVGSRRRTGTNIIEVQDRTAYDVLSTVASGDPGFILSSIVNFIDTLDGIARSAVPGAQTDYYLTQKPGLTKFNSIGAHTLVWMAVEMFTALFSAFPTSTFGGADPSTSRVSSRVIRVDRDAAAARALKLALQTMLPTSIATPLSQSSFFGDDIGTLVRTMVSRLTALDGKLTAEDTAIRDITNLFLALGNSIKEASDGVVRFFDAAGPNGPALASILQGIDASNKLGCLDVAQVTLSRNSLMEHRAGVAAQPTSHDDVSRAGAVSPFVDDTAVNPGARSALFSMLRSSKMLSPIANNLRLLSIGLPAGFMDALHQRLSTHVVGTDISSFNEQRTRRNDVIKLNIYMKDLLFDDLVFLPQSFIFQVGRFVSAADFTDVGATDVRDFDTMVRETIRTRVLSVDGATFLTELGKDAARDQSYEGVLTADQGLELAKNHVTSYMLKLYVKLLTGVDLAEDRFYVNSKVASTRLDSETLDKFKRLIETRVSSFARRPLTLDELKDANVDVAVLLSRLEGDVALSSAVGQVRKVLDDASKAANVEISEELSTFMRTFTPSSILFGSGARRLRVTSPKLFERVLNVVVDPDDFMVDHGTTTSTTSGQAFISSAIATKLLDKLDIPGFPPVIRLDGLQRRALGGISLQEFFVTIEQLPELPPPRSTIQVVRPRIASPESQRPVVVGRGASVSASAAAAQLSRLGVAAGPPPTPNEEQQSTPAAPADAGTDWSRYL